MLTHNYEKHLQSSSFVIEFIQYRIKLNASDKESGVHQIGLDFEIHIPNYPDTIVTKVVPANTDLVSTVFINI